MQWFIRIQPEKHSRTCKFYKMTHFFYYVYLCVCVPWNFIQALSHTKQTLLYHQMHSYIFHDFLKGSQIMILHTLTDLQKKNESSVICYNIYKPKRYLINKISQAQKLNTSWSQLYVEFCRVEGNITRSQLEVREWVVSEERKENFVWEK